MLLGGFCMYSIFRIWRFAPESSFYATRPKASIDASSAAFSPLVLMVPNPGEEVGRGLAWRSFSCGQGLGFWGTVRAMRGMGVKAAWLGVIGAFLAPWLHPLSVGAQADSTHYQTLQLGERSRGMAGAYTAYAADGAAIWFNPAGLPLLEPRLLQGSLSLLQRRTLKISGAVVTDGPDGPGGEDQVSDFNLKSNPNLPGFAVASFAVGKRKEELDNRKPLQIAISAFVLYNVSQGGDINFQDEFGRTNSLQFYQDDRASYFAAAIGHRPTRNFSWGITLLARNRVIQHVETASLTVGGTQDPSLGSPCPTSPTIPFCVFDATQISRNTVFRMNAWDLSLRIGLLNLIGKRWRVGLMFQPPGLNVGGKSNLRFELTDVISSNSPVNPGLSDSVFGTPQSGARSPIPWELRLGVSYVISSKVAVCSGCSVRRSGPRRLGRPWDPAARGPRQYFGHSAGGLDQAGLHLEYLAGLGDSNQQVLVHSIWFPHRQQQRA